MAGKSTQQKVLAGGIDLIRDPLLNKGTAFTRRERVDFGLEGLLPSAVLGMDLQAQRVYSSVHAKETPMEKYIGLMALQDRNEQLFYRVLVEHLKEFMPIVYTPTVAQATSNFSHVLRRARGVWITPDFRGRIREVLQAAVRGRNIELIVATDNESILGIGDQGAGGMAISIGKLALYTAGAGIHPSGTLPVSLDVGTNNERLLADDLYVGWREPRLRGGDYDSLIEEFVTACRELFPGVLIQWEDFRKDNALNILERYRFDFPSFNDDIQGTGAVALAGLMSAMRITGQSLADQRIVIFGAGAAGLGIARQIRAGLAATQGEQGGPPMLGVLDSRGLLVDDREIRDSYKRELAWDVEGARHYGFPEDGARDLAAVVEHFRPTVLIGSSGQAGAFSEPIVRKIAGYCERPVVLPFSNPDSLAEAKPEDLYRWTDGRVLVATGSPFAPVEFGGKKYRIGQGNNVFIFPGLGLGTLLCGAGRISNAMITAAAQALAHQVNDAEVSAGMLFPGIDRLREVTVAVTRSVIQQACAEGAADGSSDRDVDALIADAMWWPEYRDYRRV
ncbi:MAG: NAD-dependent malic enzyme [Gammaproteobacteria bacterium]|nr:NAD-dependent malic enzyme [Gammaproteobacteria bacterium]NNF61710.1 NAD-dependent malic enzyme [Gammaproteobacteria bacterium]NNM21765.1 NAD-dependent malic enzyme [Gammaproteobacteria bacterium]